MNVSHLNFKATNQTSRGPYPRVRSSASPQGRQWSCKSDGALAFSTGALAFSTKPTRNGTSNTSSSSFARTETYIGRHPCVELLPYVTLSITKTRTRCLYLNPPSALRENSLTNQNQVAFPYCPAAHPHRALSGVGHYH